MLETFRNQYLERGCVSLPGFLDDGQLAQFRAVLADVAWVPRGLDADQGAIPDPDRHGLLTGRICEFLSQPPLLDHLAAITGRRAAHFAGNFVRLVGDATQSWAARPGLAADAALVISLGPEALRIATGPDLATEFTTGDAVLMDIAGHTHRMTAGGRALAIAGCPILAERATGD